MPISVSFAHDPIEPMVTMRALPSFRKEKGYEDEGDNDDQDVVVVSAAATVTVTETSAAAAAL